MKLPKSVVLSIFLFLSGCSNLSECEHLKGYLTSVHHGTVIKKYLDSANHMIPTIIYKTNVGKKGFDTNIGRYVPSAFDTIDVGDVISKSAGSTIVVITKGDYTITIDTARDTRRFWCH